MLFTHFNKTFVNYIGKEVMVIYENEGPLLVITKTKIFVILVFMFCSCIYLKLVSVKWFSLSIHKEAFK